MKSTKVLMYLVYISITLASSFKIVGTMGYYALFKEDFVERFCENKIRPELQCNRKCTLAKNVNTEFKRRKNPINIDWLKNENIIFINRLVTVEFDDTSVEHLNNHKYSNLYYYSFSRSTLHPSRF